jgi:hydroxymethylpyrimidine pyrophosphatase-like HAD family hydrolase
MKDLALAPRSTFASVRFVLTDMDETLTYRGRLWARTCHALERLQDAGVKVIPVTAAGWCDQMARMWPVDGVISENGNLFIQRDGEYGVKRKFWHGDPDAVLYCGDSTNDAPMFGFFRHTVGVGSVRRYLPEIPILPNWITKGPGGDGFVEVADAVIASKICAS